VEHIETGKWRKSTRSGSGNECVEVAGDLAALRDSKAPQRGQLRVSVLGVVGAIKAGRIGSRGSSCCDEPG